MVALRKYQHAITRLVCCTLFSIASISSATAQSAAAAATDPVLMPGDVIRITVWMKPELSGEFGISQDSTVADPFYMGVKVAGIPLSSAATRVRSHVEQYETNPRVLVEPVFRIAVAGEVRQPSIYSVQPGSTVLQAVMHAGGPTQNGRRDQVRLLRNGQQITFNLQQADTELVRSGDRIVVDPQRTIFREYVIPALTVVGAIASVIRVWRL